MKKIVGIEMTSRSLRGVEVDRLGSASPKVKKHFEMTVEPGIFNNNEIVNTELAARALSVFWKEGKFSTKNAVVGIGNPKVVVRNKKLPRNSVKSKAALPFVAAGNDLPINVENSVMDFWISKDTPSSREVEGLLVASPRDTIIKIIEAFETARINLVAIDLVPFALLRSLKLGEESAFVVDVGDSVITFVVLEKGVPTNVRFIPHGEAKLVEAIQKATGVKYSRAREILRGLGVGRAPRDKKEAYVIASIDEEAKRLFKNISDTIIFYNKEARGESFDKIVFMGQCSDIPGLFENTKEALSKKVFKDGEIVLADSEASLAIPEGLALWGNNV